MSLKERILRVLGDQELTAHGILERLRSRGWAPDTVTPVYLTFMLSAHEKEIREIDVGLYRARPQYQRLPSKPPPTLWQHIMAD